MTREEAARVLTELADEYEKYELSANGWLGTTYIPAHRMGVAALREQLKRSEGCEFCRPNDWERKPLGTFEIIHDDYSTEEHEIGIDDFEGGYRIASTIMFRGPSFDINYCPVCGKELFGNPEQVKEGGE